MLQNTLGHKIQTLSEQYALARLYNFSARSCLDIPNHPRRDLCAAVWQQYHCTKKRLPAPAWLERRERPLLRLLRLLPLCLRLSESWFQLTWQSCRGGGATNAPSRRYSTAGRDSGTASTALRCGPGKRERKEKIRKKKKAALCLASACLTSTFISFSTIPAKLLRVVFLLPPFSWPSSDAADRGMCRRGEGCQTQGVEGEGILGFNNAHGAQSTVWVKRTFCLSAARD